MMLRYLKTPIFTMLLCASFVKTSAFNYMVEGSAMIKIEDIACRPAGFWVFF